MAGTREQNRCTLVMDMQALAWAPARYPAFVLGERWEALMHQPRRPASPWAGSTHELDHRWALDGCTSLLAVAEAITGLADEFREAQNAGWWLDAPVRSGHLHFARLSRRQRAHGVHHDVRVGECEASRSPWRLRILAPGMVPDPPVPHLDLARAVQTPALRWNSGRWEQVAGPKVSSSVLGELASRFEPAGLPPCHWGLVEARVGPSADLVADGAPLLIHGIDERGHLVRTLEAVDLIRTAEGASTLATLCERYVELARTIAAMSAAGGRLVSIADGLVEVAYDTNREVTQLANIQSP